MIHFIIFSYGQPPPATKKVIGELACHVSLDKKSVSLCPSPKGYGVTFTYDSTYDCQISFYFCTTETSKPQISYWLN